MHIWQDKTVGILNDGAYFIKPYKTSDGFYKFKKSQLGTNTEFDFEKYMNTSGKLYHATNLDDFYGKAWTVKQDSCTSYIPGETHAVNLGKVSKKINNGVQLDPNKTYHMVVFYMERGEAESNFSVNFTMTPANNDLKVTKALDTGYVVSEISDDLKANETFDYTIKENGKDTSGKGYKLTKSDGSTSNETLSNSGFTLKDNYIADFDNSFKTGNEMKVNESTDSSKLKYTTNWELVNNRVGSIIKSGSATESEFNLADPADKKAYAQLQLDYTNKIVTAPLEISKNVVDEDGKKYGLSFTQSDEGLEGVEYVELDNGTQVRQARSLYDLATSGISIPDLRMVNCYQKFLELNMRKGYSYKDIVEGRFDVKVRYADLLMPEFFGGVSRDIDVNSITQTVDQNVQGQTSDYDKALGSQAGLAGVRGEANANIECFCDEESIIMGLLIVTPLPVYTQLLPKHFTYRGLMEHYQPEFNLIGFQPIKYNEVCPIQAYNDNPDSLTETFGYNRPWYEFAQKYDVAHGLFRTSLSNFLMHRVFDQKPQLAQSFLTVDPEQVTDVFAVTETTDKIYGQIWLDITCKLPIARVAIPRLD